MFASAEALPVLHAELSRHLSALLLELSPEHLGLYWPIRSEFNAPAACLADMRLAGTPFSLPFCVRSPIALGYRAWNRQAPTVRDECGIATGDGPAVEPDVVLVPCVGFTASGYRLGYGGGYFDRWMAAHPHVAAVGVAWSVAEISEADLQPQPHDQALSLVLTERGVV